MKKKRIIKGVLSLILLISICIIISLLVKGNNTKTLTHNIGASNINSNINITDDGISEETVKINEVVPAKEELIELLSTEGYIVEEKYSISEEVENCERIIAQKDNKFIDITYCNDDHDAKLILKEYKDKYSDFYLMAQNEKYAYCISDKKTFELAGFKSLANIGEQFIYE